MVKFFPGLWTWFSKKMGWMPSGIEKPEKYEQIKGVIWSNAIKWASGHKTNLCIGHTHTHCDTQIDDGIRFIDCGMKRVIQIDC
jgi:hypothetical protein